MIIFLIILPRSWAFEQKKAAGEIFRENIANTLNAVIDLKVCVLKYIFFCCSVCLFVIHICCCCLVVICVVIFVK